MHLMFSTHFDMTCHLEEVIGVHTLGVGDVGISTWSSNYFKDMSTLECSHMLFCGSCYSNNEDFSGVTT